MSNSILQCPFHSIDKEIEEFDMLDPKARENPFPYYEWLRQDEEKRIYKLPQEKTFYVVHRHEDVKNILQNHEDFINHILPTKKSPFFALMDGDEHLRKRNVVSKIFSTKKPLIPFDQIDENIKKITKEMLQKNEVELFKDWADLIPLSTLCMTFGLDYSSENIEKLHTQAITINRALFVLGGTGPRRSETPSFTEKMVISFSLIKNITKILKLYKILGKVGLTELKDMFFPKKTLVETPRPDFKALPNAITPLVDLILMFSDLIKNKNEPNQVIQLLRSSILEEEITLTEAVMICTFIIFSGYETTTSLLSNCATHLAKNETVYNNLKANPSEIDTFIEEALRIYTPVGRFLRRAKQDVSISGNLIPKGSIVILMLGAANTDPSVFDSPFLFNSNRKNLNQNLSFGKGVHFCSGISLARHQIKLALVELLNKSTTIKLKKNFIPKMVTDRDNGILRYEKLFFNFN
jgi:cytochrome P450